MATNRKKHRAPVPVFQRDPGPWSRLLIDWLATLAVIMIFGLVMLFSASYTTGYLRMGDSFHYIKQQALCMILGLGCMFLISYVDHRFLRKMVVPGYFIVLAMLAGGVCAAIAGVLIGIPVLRLRGDYLAIVTLAFGEIIRNVMNCLYFAVSDGKLIINFNNPRIDGTLLYNGPAGAVRVGRIATFEAGFVLVLLTLFVVLNLINSRSGRAIMASRDNRIAAEAMGVNVTKYKLMAFVTSAALAGMAGALFGLNFSSIAPDKFKFDTSILVLVFVVLGGIGNIRGSVIAAALLTVLPEVLREFGDYRMLIYAIVLIAVMLLGNAPVVRQVLERIRPAKKEVVKEGDAA